MINQNTPKLSEHLKGCLFIKIQANHKEPSKDKKTGSWEYLTFNEANEWLNNGGNVAFLPSKDFILIDCDKVEVANWVYSHFEETYTEQSCSGGYHFIYHAPKIPESILSNDYKNLYLRGESSGELRYGNAYTIIAPSKAPSKQDGTIKPYKLLKDIKPSLLTEEQILSLLNEFKGSSSSNHSHKTLSPELLKRVEADEELKELFYLEAPEGTRSEKEQSLTNKLRARDFTKEEAHHIISNSKIGKLKEKPLSYWELMWDKACSYVTQMKTEYIPQEVINQRIQQAPVLNLLGISEIRRIKPRKDFLIKEFLYPRENVMIYGASGSLKSYFSLYLALTLASKRKFLGKQTKQTPVLYLGAEDSEEQISKRVKALLKGMKIRSSRIPFYYLPRKECGDLLDTMFKARILKTLQEKNIKLLIIDTINPVTPSVDDNNGRDVTRVFNEFLKPVCDTFGISSLFLHHTTKTGKDFLGSTKWKGNSDNFFCVERKGLSPTIKIYNEKNRSGEAKTLEIGFTFDEDKTTLNLLSESEPLSFKSKGKMTQQELFLLKLNELCNPDMERKEIQETFAKNNIKYTPPTLDRAIREWRGVKDE